MAFALIKYAFAYASSSGRSRSPSRSGVLIALIDGTDFALPLSLLSPSSYAALIAALIAFTVSTSLFGMISETEYFGLEPLIDFGSKCYNN